VSDAERPAESGVFRVEYWHIQRGLISSPGVERPIGKQGFASDADMSEAWFFVDH